MDLQEIIDRQAKTIESLTSRCYRLKMANDTLLMVVKELTSLLYAKWKDDE